MKAADPTVAANEAILDHVEAIGGGCVWESEIFAVTLMDVPATDSEVAVLAGLRGVQQIALNASKLSFPIIEAIARIPGLESLVLSEASLSAQQLQVLQVIGLEIVLVTDEV